MKSREGLLRLKRFQVEEKRRQFSQIETMIMEFDRMSIELDGQIAFEEKKAGISDVNHFAYPTFAKAARQRRENLQGSIVELKDQMAAAEIALGEVDEDLKKAVMLDDRDGGKGREALNLEQQRAEALHQRAMIG
jgi:flagellar export protein FliJ